MRLYVPKPSPYFSKDSAKASEANCFIGRGSPKSSTHAYAESLRSAGYRVNANTYSPKDYVFVSVEGNRPNRVPLDKDLVALAAKAGVTFITDTAFHRSRPYNVGERELAELLFSLGYEPMTQEGPRSGTWIKKVTHEDS